MLGSADGRSSPFLFGGDECSGALFSGADRGSRLLLLSGDERSSALFGGADRSRSLLAFVTDERSGALFHRNSVCPRVREFAFELEEPLAFASEPLFDIAKIFGKRDEIGFELRAAVVRHGCGGGGRGSRRRGRHLKRGHVPRVSASGALVRQRGFISRDVEHGQLGSSLEVPILGSNVPALHAHSRVPLCFYASNIARGFAAWVCALRNF